jgi:hypothetical protein
MEFAEEFEGLRIGESLNSSEVKNEVFSRNLNVDILLANAESVLKALLENATDIVI